MPVFTDKQPKDGDNVLLCDHVMESNKTESHKTDHFFYMPEPLTFVRPDGTGANANWFVICEECFLKYPNPTLKQLMIDVIRADAVWNGNEPEIKINPRMN